MEIFEIGGVCLQLTESDSKEVDWIEAWYYLPNGHCVTEKFMVLDTGEPAYQQISDALERFGREAFEGTIKATQMSPAFTDKYLFPAAYWPMRPKAW